MFKALFFAFVLLTLLGCESSSEREREANEESSLSYLLCDIGVDSECVNSDEEVTLFNSYGFKDGDGRWHLRLQGWIVEPSSSTLLTTLFYELITTVVGTTTSKPSFTDERIHQFIGDNKGGELLHVVLANKEYTLNPTEESGLFSEEIIIDAKALEGYVNNNTLSYRVLLPKGDSRDFSGSIYLRDDNTTMLISDIDDTIKITQVYLGLKEVIASTFLKPFMPASKMSELYKTLMIQHNTTEIAYLSGSPWQLYSLLESFIVDNGFSNGSFHLKALRLNPLSSTLYEFIEPNSTYEHKIATLTQIFEDFPNKHFILIGDSGEKDPEIYGQIHQKYPTQIEAIYIRNVTQESVANSRFLTAFGEYAKQVHLIEEKPWTPYMTLIP